MYIDTVPNRNSRPTILLREARREGKKIIKRTVANITKWPPEKVEALRRVFRNETLVSPDEVFDVERSLPHGHVEAVLAMIRRIGLDKLIASKRTRERDLVLAMIAERLIAPCSKLATTRMWHSSTLAQLMKVEDADEDELYAAMDWLLKRQSQIEKRLAARHLSEGKQVFYDVSSSYYEGRCCSLAHFGHDRDKKRGKRIIVYGVMTDSDGRPLAVEAYPGNTGDPSTVPDQVDKLRGRFELEKVVLVGDRGMLTQAQIKVLKTHPGIGWISALRSEKVHELVKRKHLQPSLFDERNLAEIRSADFPGERLIVCYNPLLAEERRRKRSELLEATEQALGKILAEVRRRTRTPLSAAEIGQKVGKVIQRYKMGKHFELRIADGQFSFSRKTDAIEAEAGLDGIYVIRTSETGKDLSAEDTVRSYKNLARVEQAFRTLKGMDLRIRPIHHRDNQRVRAHIFLCMLAYYVEWHMRKALAPLLFDDETLPEERRRRDPVAPAKPTSSAKKKKSLRKSADGLPIHSFTTLLEEMGTLCRNQCRFKSDPHSQAFFKYTNPTPLQSRALELIRSFPVTGS